MLDIGHCKLAAVLAAGTCLAGGARALTIETDSETGVTTLNASADEHVALTAEHVAQFGAGGLVKTGAGTVQAGDEMAGYTGPITVREGYYDVLTRGALGTADGDTFVDGGTLINHVASDTNGQSPSFANEHIHLKGTGWADNGALQNKVNAADFCRKVTLEGDTRVTGTLRCDFRYTAFDMKGFDLTTSFSGDGFYLVALTVANAGNLTAEGGAFEFQAHVNGTSATKTALFKSGSTLSFFNSASWLNHRFVMEDNTTLHTGNDAFKLEGTDNRGIINGVLELRGTLKNDISKNHQTQWRGYVTGPGGFTGGKGGWVQINGPTNDFRGGLDLTGVAENGRATGGVVVWDDGAVPADGAPLKLRNAELWNWSDRPVTLPDFVVDGVGTVTGKTLTAAMSVKSLAKTGTGDLRVALPLKVKGAADVQSGSLTLGTRVPENLGGPNHYYRPGNSGAVTETAVPGGLPLSGVTSGADYAYKAWPSGVDQAHYYTGYIRVPGEEGADVRCNFMTSMARACRVIIGGVTCALQRQQERPRRHHRRLSAPRDVQSGHAEGRLAADLHLHGQLVGRHARAAGQHGPGLGVELRHRRGLAGPLRDELGLLREARRPGRRLLPARLAADEGQSRSCAVPFDVRGPRGVRFRHDARHRRHPALHAVRRPGPRGRADGPPRRGQGEFVRLDAP